MALAYRIEPDIEPIDSGHQNLAYLPRPTESDGIDPHPRHQASETENATAATNQATVASVSSLPRKPHLPLWINILVGVQQGSTVITGGLMAAALVVYSWTVYVDKMVFRTGQQLEALQTETQQITTANETLKHNMAEQVHAPASNFRPYEPNQTIFLEPATPRQFTPNNLGHLNQPSSLKGEKIPAPLGY